MNHNILKLTTYATHLSCKSTNPCSLIIVNNACILEQGIWEWNFSKSRAPYNLHTTLAEFLKKQRQEKEKEKLWRPVYDIEF